MAETGIKPKLQYLILGRLVQGVHYFRDQFKTLITFLKYFILNKWLCWIPVSHIFLFWLFFWKLCYSNDDHQTQCMNQSSWTCFSLLSSIRPDQSSFYQREWYLPTRSRTSVCYGRYTFPFKYLHKKKSSGGRSGDLGGHSMCPNLEINFPGNRFLNTSMLDFVVWQCASSSWKKSLAKSMVSTIGIKYSFNISP